MSLLSAEHLFHPVEDIYGFLRDEYDCAIFPRSDDANNLTSLTPTDAKVIAEVDLPPGGIPGLQLVRSGVTSDGSAYPRRYIISSPNMNWIPDISKYRQTVRMNADTRFGYHDFTLWPQLYFPETRHLSFARCRPADSEMATHPWPILWHDLTRLDFDYEPGTVFTDLGRISSGLLDQIMDFRRYLTQRITVIQSQPPPCMRDTDKAALSAALLGIRLTSVCLRIAAQSYLTTQATFTLFQRHALEGLACVEMLMVWDKKAQADTEDVPLDFVDPTVMGTITHSIQVAIEMAMLGVPVWLIRPPHSVPSKTIKILAKEYPVGLRNERASVTPIADMKEYYNGAPSYRKNRACLCLHLGHIHLGGRGEVYKEIVYVAVPSGPSASPGPSAPVVAGPVIPHKIGANDNETTDIDYSVNTEKYKSPGVHFCPAIMPRWAEALRNTPQDPKLILKHPDARLLRGYALLDPWLLARDDRTGERNLVVWLFVRSAWISQVTTLWAAGSHFPSAQDWRFFLTSVARRMGFDWSEDAHSSTSSSRARPAPRPKRSGAKRTRTVQGSPAIETLLLQVFPLNLPVSIPRQDLYWRGVVVVRASEYDLRPLPISDLVRAEILWDLLEQNFRVELLATDRCILPRATMSLHEAEVRDEWVSQVFPSGSPVNTSLSEESVGAKNLAFRAKYLNGFRRVVQTWGTFGESLKEERFRDIDKSSNPTVVDELERLAFNIYCTTFFKYFGRAPTVPHIFPTSAK